jgi:hypothetical protein
MKNDVFEVPTEGLAKKIYDTITDSSTVGYYEEVMYPFISRVLETFPEVAEEFIKGQEAAFTERQIYITQQIADVGLREGYKIRRNLFETLLQEGTIPHYDPRPLVRSIEVICEVTGLSFHQQIHAQDMKVILSAAVRAFQIQSEQTAETLSIDDLIMLKILSLQNVDKSDIHRMELIINAITHNEQIDLEIETLQRTKLENDRRISDLRKVFNQSKEN